MKRKKPVECSYRIVGGVKGKKANVDDGCMHRMLSYQPACLKTLELNREMGKETNACLKVDFSSFLFIKDSLAFRFLQNETSRIAA